MAAVGREHAAHRRQHLVRTPHLDGSSPLLVHFVLFGVCTGGMNFTIVL